MQIYLEERACKKTIERGKKGRQITQVLAFGGTQVVDSGEGDSSVPMPVTATLRSCRVRENIACLFD